MSQPFQAIYENGILRPLGLLGFKDREVVTLFVAEPTASDCGRQPDADEDPAIIEVQQRAIAEMLEEATSLPVLSTDDGFSGSDHDRLLYGGPA